MVVRFLWSLTLLASAVEVCQEEISTACYGTNALCDYYSIQCPASQIIKLNNLYAGVKTQQFCGTNSSTDHCDYSAECCNYVAGDNVEHFNLENTYNAYTNCSGRQSCQNVQAPWQLMTSLLPNAVTSTYVQLEYGCELASSKVPLCGGTTGSVAGVYSTVEIIFDGSTENFDPLKASKECRCTVQNIGARQNIVFKTIDVRLPSYHRDVNESVTACSSATYIVNNVLSARCVESTTHYQYNFYYNRTETLTLGEGQTSDISLMNIHQNGTYDSPAMVWISLTAETGRNFQLTCKEVIPAQFTTTTTTTTTTTSTTKTTTTTTSATTSTTTTTAASTTTTSTSATTNTTKQTTTNIITTTPKPTTTIITTMPRSTKLTTSTITEPATTSSISSSSITTSAANPTSPATRSSALTSVFTRTTQSARVPFTITVIDGDRRTVVILAIAFPITVGVLIIAAVIFWAVWKRKKHRQVRKGNTRLPETMKGVETEDIGTYEIIQEQGNAIPHGIIPDVESRPTDPSEISLNEESENTGPYEILPQLEQGNTQPVNIPNVESRITGTYEAVLNVEQRNSRLYETILNSEQTQSNQHFPPEESKITRPYENIPTVEQRNDRSYETNSDVKSEGTQRYKTVLNVDKSSAPSLNTRNSESNRNVEPRQAQALEVEQLISLPYETLSSVELDNAGHYEIIQDENTIYSTNV